MSLGFGISLPSHTQPNGTQQALSILRRPGLTSHVIAPGANGVSVSGLTAGNYLLPDGSTGYAAVDGLDGLVLDGMGGVGSELVTNGDFTSGSTGWTTIQTGWSIAAGAASVNSAGAGSTIIRQGASVVGSTYRITFTITAYTSGLIYPIVGSTLSLAGVNALGTYTFHIKAADTTGFGVYGQSTTAVATIDNVSCVEVTGIHATASGAARPTLRRGLVNLIKYSTAFSDAAWSKGGVVTVTSGQAAPDGTLTAFKLDRASGAGNSYADLSSVTGYTVGAGNNVGKSYTVAAMLWCASGTESCALAISDLSYATYTGAITVTTTPTLFVFTSSGGAGWNPLGSVIGCGVNIGANRTVFSNGIGLFQGTLTAAQILANGGIPLTTTAAASNATAGQYSFEFAGAQSLSLGSVPFQMSDDHCVIAGGSLGALSSRTLCAPSYTGSTSRYAAVGVTPTGVQVEWYDGTNYVPHTTNASLSDVVVITGRKSGSTLTSRKNAVQFGSSAAFATAVSTTLGAIGGGPLTSFIGTIGPVIMIKGTVTDAELLTLERFVASLTPNAPTF